MIQCRLWVREEAVEAPVEQASREE
jgi:hypothetical protein